MARSASDREGHTSSLNELVLRHLCARFCHPCLGRVGSWPSSPTWGCVPSANSHVGKSIRTLNSSPIRFTMASLGTVSWGRFATMMRATSGCLFSIMARESIQLAQCATLQPLVALVNPDPQTRTAETPSPVNARTALALQSTSRDIPTCWRRDWPQTAGPTLGERTSTKNWHVGLRRREGPTTRFGGLPLPGFAKRSSCSLVFLARNSST